MSEAGVPTFNDVRVVIPARFGSTRFPGKPLVPVAGVPLVLRVAERVCATVPQDRVLIATESQQIADVVLEAGYEARMTSDSCLTGTDRVWEATRDDSARIIINVQGDEPLIQPGDILAVLEEARRRPGWVVNAMCPITDEADIRSVNVPKVVVDPSGRMVYMSRLPVPGCKQGIGGGPYYRQVCIYAFNSEHLERYAGLGQRGSLEEREDIEILRFLELDVPVAMVTVSGNSVAVDVPEDVARVEALLRL